MWYPSKTDVFNCILFSIVAVFEDIVTVLVTNCESDTLQDHPTSGNVPNGESEPSQTLANFLHHFGWLKQDEIWNQNNQIHWNYSRRIIRLRLTWHLQIIIYRQMCLKLIIFMFIFSGEDFFWHLDFDSLFRSMGRTVYLPTWKPIQISMGFSCRFFYTYLSSHGSFVASASTASEGRSGFSQALSTALRSGSWPGVTADSLEQGMVINPRPLRGFLGVPHLIRIPVIKGGMSFIPNVRSGLDHGTYDSKCLQ